MGSYDATVSFYQEETMRRVLATAAVLTIALVIAAPSSAAKGPTLQSLQAQVTSLQKQVKKLKKDEQTTRNVALGAVVYTGCSLAVVADAFQGTWMTVTSGSTLFGAQTPVNDYNTCQAFSIVRAKSQVPPTVSVIQAVIDYFFK
jgi:hypothetical protein